MIFDSEKAQRLCTKYVKIPDFKVPEFVFLARSPELTDERSYLESLIAAVSRSKRKDWIGRLVNTDTRQFLGAWFQIMLFGWLQNVGSVVAEPKVEGNDPDFLLSVGDQQIVIEAAALLLSQEERELDILQSELCWLLDQIPRPFVVAIKHAVLSKPLNPKTFTDAITRWLDTLSGDPYLYEDGANKVQLVAHREPKLDNVASIAIFKMQRANANAIKPVLHKKSRQHQTVRNRDYPYVLAIMLESRLLSPEQVVAAWFGETQVVLDLTRNEIIEQRFDRSGLHFLGDEIVHTTVSGTLIFQRTYEEGAPRHDLVSWYVENPFAKVRIDPNLFPAKSRYIVTKADATTVWMDWQPHGA